MWESFARRLVPHNLERPYAPNAVLDETLDEWGFLCPANMEMKQLKTAIRCKGLVILTSSVLFLYNDNPRSQGAVETVNNYALLGLVTCSSVLHSWSSAKQRPSVFGIRKGSPGKIFWYKQRSEKAVKKFFLI